MANSVIQTSNLAIGYSNGKKQYKTVLSDINLSLYPSELVCLMGSNGSGKSTLIKTLTGVVSPLAGDVLLYGKNLHHADVKELAQQISVVLTDRIENEVLTVWALVSLGRLPYTSWMGDISKADIKIIDEAISIVGIESLKDRRVNDLSDGERQKVMIARALAQQTPVIFLDEPTAFLDIQNKVEIMALLRNLAHSHNKSILVSIHDAELAMQTADRLWIVSNGNAILTGVPEELAMQGHLGAMFNNEKVFFDDTSGVFKMKQHFSSEIEISGDDNEVYWTARTLEKIGVKALLNSNTVLPRSITITKNENISWQLNTEGKQEVFNNLTDLIKAIRRA
jgi:iron complex transport system ATP-binding protein